MRRPDPSVGRALMSHTCRTLRAKRLTLPTQTDFPSNNLNEPRSVIVTGSAGHRYQAGRGDIPAIETQRDRGLCRGWDFAGAGAESVGNLAHRIEWTPRVTSDARGVHFLFPDRSGRNRHFQFHGDPKGTLFRYGDTFGDFLPGHSAARDHRLGVRFRIEPEFHRSTGPGRRIVDDQPGYRRQGARRRRSAQGTGGPTDLHRGGHRRVDHAVGDRVQHRRTLPRVVGGRAVDPVGEDRGFRSGGLGLVIQGIATPGIAAATRNSSSPVVIGTAHRDLVSDGVRGRVDGSSRLPGRAVVRRVFVRVVLSGATRDFAGPPERSGGVLRAIVLRIGGSALQLFVRYVESVDNVGPGAGPVRWQLHRSIHRGLRCPAHGPLRRRVGPHGQGSGRNRPSAGALGDRHHRRGCFLIPGAGHVLLHPVHAARDQLCRKPGESQARPADQPG